MRVKVGSTWYECKLGQPVMVELSPGERQQIADMAPDCTRYAQFDDDEPLTRDEMFAWMNEGARYNDENPTEIIEGSKNPEGDS